MAPDPENQGDAAAIIKTVEDLSKAELINVAGGDVTAPLLIVPDGKSIHSLKRYLREYAERPDRKIGRTRLTTLEAFCAYVNRHKTAHTVVFVDDVEATRPRLVAIFNAHQASHEVEGDLQLRDGLPDFQDFMADYPFPLSPEWRAWTSLPPSFGQADFANFLEDRIGDVIEAATAGNIAKKFAADLGVALASPARLMQLAKGLSVTVDARVAQAVNLSSGEATIHFSEEHKDADGKVPNIPGAFVIGIPVFRLGAPYQIPVRLRYRVNSGRITWSLSLQRADHVFEHAIDEAATKVGAAVERPVFRGRVVDDGVVADSGDDD